MIYWNSPNTGLKLLSRKVSVKKNNHGIVILPIRTLGMTADNNTDGGRKFFRIPIDDSSNVSISIQGKGYQVLNVAAGGVGIYLNNIDTFSTGDEIENIVLTIDSTSCDVTGRIAHVSPNNDRFLCGIELLAMDQKTNDLLQRFIDNHRASLFSFMPD